MESWPEKWRRRKERAANSQDSSARRDKPPTDEVDDTELEPKASWSERTFEMLLESAASAQTPQRESVQVRIGQSAGKIVEVTADRVVYLDEAAEPPVGHWGLRGLYSRLRRCEKA